MKAVVLLALACVACSPTPITGKRLSNLGTRSEGGWCNPGRGLPPDPVLGIERPMTFGVASIVHELDSTSESFVVERALRAQLRVPERQVEITLVEHPSDADYSVTGIVSGRVTYARESDASILLTLLQPVGFLVGGSIAGSGLLVTAIDGKDHSTLIGSGAIGLGVGALGTIYTMTRPANHYTWDQTAKLTLRRGSVVIGELVVHDVYDDIRWSPIDRPREYSEGRLWKHAAAELAGCIKADLEGGPATGALAEATR